MLAKRDISPDDTIPFAGATIEVIRAIQQRGLLNRWLSLYSPLQRAPPFEEFHLEAADPKLTSAVLVIMDIENGRPQIVIGNAGARLDKVYGAAGGGRELGEYLGPQLARVIMPIYQTCIRRGLPVYTVSQVQDRENRKVDLERLLLPFGDGKRITHIVASFETISAEGFFDIDRLMREQLPVDVVRAVIDQKLYFERPSRIAARDRIEFE
ncbi:PAS domain protein OS=Afipia felis OX=1035 GN=NCTC12722_02537 PE=4 SV=1 [Afipia felis]